MLCCEGDCILTSSVFVLAIDHITSCEILHPCAALAAQFAAFYIFNLQYTQSAAVTLEFIQRFVIFFYMPA